MLAAAPSEQNKFIVQVAAEANKSKASWVDRALVQTRKR